MIERELTVAAEAGLHARPAAQVTNTATQYDAEVTIAHADAGAFVPANSMLAVSGLNVRQGETVVVRADGPDAAAAIDALEQLLTEPAEESADRTAGTDDG